MKKIWWVLISVLFTTALAASSLEGASSELATDLSTPLAGKTVAVLDMLDQQRNVRELGRIMSDQYLRVDLAKKGVKTVTRSQLNQILGELKLSQTSFAEAVASGKLVDFKLADTVVAGSISQIGDSYTVSVEALDVRTGATIEASRSTFPKTSSIQPLWDNIIEKGGSTSVGDVAVAPQPVTNNGNVLLDKEIWKGSGFEAFLAIIEIRSDKIILYLNIKNVSNSVKPLRFTKNSISIKDNQGIIYEPIDFEPYNDVLQPGSTYQDYSQVKIDYLDLAKTSIFVTLNEPAYVKINQTWELKLPR